MTDHFTVDELFDRWVSELTRVDREPDIALIASIETVAARDGWSVQEYASHLAMTSGCRPKIARGRRVKVMSASGELDGEVVSHLCNPVDDNDPLIIVACGCGGDYDRQMAVPQSYFEGDDEHGYEYDERYEEHSYETTNRQQAQEEALEKIEEVYGKFDKTTGADGSHYVEASPFKADGLVCANCVFYEGPRGCEIVEGDIDPDAVCKFWIIPNELLEGPEHEEHEDHYEYDMLGDDAVYVLGALTAATNFNPDLHPRAKDGKFINVLGFIDLLYYGKVYRGQVTAITPDKNQPGQPDITVDVMSGVSGDVVDTITVKPRSVMTAAKSKARLQTSGETSEIKPSDMWPNDPSLLSVSDTQAYFTPSGGKLKEPNGTEEYTVHTLETPGGNYTVTRKGEYNYTLDTPEGEYSKKYFTEAIQDAYRKAGMSGWHPSDRDKRGKKTSSPTEGMSDEEKTTLRQAGVADTTEIDGIIWAKDLSASQEDIDALREDIATLEQDVLAEDPEAVLPAVPGDVSEPAPATKKPAAKVTSDAPGTDAVSKFTSSKESRLIARGMNGRISSGEIPRSGTSYVAASKFVDDVVAKSGATTPQDIVDALKSDGRKRNDAWVAVVLEERLGDKAALDDYVKFIVDDGRASISYDGYNGMYSVFRLDPMKSASESPAPKLSKPQRLQRQIDTLSSERRALLKEIKEFNRQAKLASDRDEPNMAKNYRTLEQDKLRQEIALRKKIKELEAALSEF